MSFSDDLFMTQGALDRGITQRGTETEIMTCCDTVVGVADVRPSWSWVTRELGWRRLENLQPAGGVPLAHSGPQTPQKLEEQKNNLLMPDILETIADCGRSQAT